MGDQIRARRLEINETQEQLASKLGISFKQVQKYEKGINRVSAARLNLIAKALDMKVEEFFDEAQALVGASLVNVTDEATLRMLQAYGRIRDQATWRQMVVLIEAIAEASNDPS
ncbi:MAG: family transcriptional regulator [Tardiphaga sp.]|jgi:transcriptional regulator with XRE-family HTH domain|nr:family transcriptional regulator [Tardiphaga sp.]